MISLLDSRWSGPGSKPSRAGRVYSWPKPVTFIEPLHPCI